MVDHTDVRLIADSVLGVELEEWIYSTREYLANNPHDNNRRQSIFEHRSVPRPEIEAFLGRSGGEMAAGG